MKIVLFEDGQPGRLVTLPEGDAERELEELIGGETVMLPLSGRRMLVTRADAEEDGLPVRYRLERSFSPPVLIRGNAALVAVRKPYIITDATKDDLRAAALLVVPAEAQEDGGTGDGTL